METKKQQKYRKMVLRALRKNQLFLSDKEVKQALKQAPIRVVRPADKPTKHECHRQATINRTRCEQKLVRSGYFLENGEMVLEDDFWPDFASFTRVEVADADVDISDDATAEWDEDVEDDILIDLTECGDDFGYLPCITDEELHEMEAELGTGFRVFSTR